jgi:arginyl-tRNA--protein-N-Asp/Glu arginylyltransferase
VTRELQFPTLYQTAPHPCPYIDSQTAVNLILDPHYPVDGPLYGRLLENGFRRNGGLYYRPFCNACRACISVRLDLDRFTPNRAQRRTAARNDDLVAGLVPAAFSDEHFQLYLEYQSVRHTGDSMDDPDPDKYQRFLVESDMDTWFMELRRRGDGALKAVAIVDFVDNGLSAIYTFFDPHEPRRSLGTQAILSQIDIGHGAGLSWLYLGYWIADSAKMAYKSRFRPLQCFRPTNSRWEAFDASR